MLFFLEIAILYNSINDCKQKVFLHGILEMINILSYNAVCMQVLYAIFNNEILIWKGLKYCCKVGISYCGH